MFDVLRITTLQSKNVHDLFYDRHKLNHNFDFLKNVIETFVRVLTDNSGS
jgi:hypothetical protein